MKTPGKTAKNCLWEIIMCRKYLALGENSSVLIPKFLNFVPMGQV